jgi:hypothetical protein
MITLRIPNRIIAGALLSGGVAVVDIGPAAGTAGLPAGCTQSNC